MRHTVHFRNRPAPDTFAVLDHDKQEFVAKFATRDEAETFASKLNISRNDLETLVNAARHRLGQAPSNSATLERAIERTTEALDRHSQRHERIPVSNAEARRLQAFRDNR
jgi:phage shock protein A